MIERTYLGIIERGNDNFGIVFPDLPGCTSVGETIDHVLVMGKEGLALHILGMIEDGEPIPLSSDVTIERVRQDIPEGDWIAIGAVTVPVPALRDMIDVPLKSDLVREISERVQRNLEGLNARQFIENAARDELERLKKSA